MIKYVDNGSVYEISENDVEMILVTAAESAEIDLKTCSQRQWKWCLQQAGKYINRTKSSFKTAGCKGPAYTIDSLIDIYNIYIELNNKYSKFIGVEAFSCFSGVPIGVIQSWSDADHADTSCIDACTIYNTNIDSTYNIDNSNIYNIDNDNVEDNKSNNNINSKRYNSKYNITDIAYNSQVDYKSRRAALNAIYSGLMSGKRECILDKAYDSNTGLSAPFLYNTEFGSYAAAADRRALPGTSADDRQAIAARYGFVALPDNEQ